MTAVCEQTDWALPWEGGCRCGKIRFRVSAPPLLTAACHCTGCQRMSASAFSLSLALPAAAFSIVTGEPVIGGMHGPARHYFCGWCLSWMFTRPDGLDDIVNLRASMLDRHEWFVPFVEFWTDEKLSWATTPAVHSFAGMASPEDFPDLIAQYAERGVCRPG